MTEYFVSDVGIWRIKNEKNNINFNDGFGYGYGGLWG